MYQTLLILHSLVRWLVLLSLIFSIYRAGKGYYQSLKFSKFDNSIRHSTATFAHIQLIVGMSLYIKSPIVHFFWKNSTETISDSSIPFFSLIHSILMFVAIVILTIGSAKAKREKSDGEKFKTILIWFTIALIIIFIAIPWPFSPLASRPYFR